MDQLASILLAFPNEHVQITDVQQYHKLASTHVQQLTLLINEKSKDMVTYSSELLQV